ncbi:MAG: shikimate kinase [Hyphomicrobiales bacterium]
MKVFLIGFMGAGKTTIGKKLARLLNYTFIDLDKVIEDEYKITINSIFERYDEKAFRKMERKMLFSTLKNKDVVISVGGGTPCFFDNMDIINKNGLSIYLRLHPKSAYTRLINSKKTRPLVNELEEEELLQYITNKLKERERFYLKAKMVVKGESLNEKQLAKWILRSPIL